MKPCSVSGMTCRTHGRELMKCECKFCQAITSPVKSRDGKYQYICPECGGYHLIFDPHAGSVDCHDCNKFTTYGGERSVDECRVLIIKEEAR